MTIKFYVNGAQVDTYRATGQQLTPEDEEAIAKAKSDAYRNYGYPAVLVVDTEDD